MDHQGSVGELRADSPNPDAFSGKRLRKGPDKLHAAGLGGAIDGRVGHWVQAAGRGVDDDEACTLSEPQHLSQAMLIHMTHASETREALLCGSPAQC